MSATAIETRIAEHEFFFGLDQEYIRFLAEHAEARELAEDKVLFSYGKPADRFYLIDSGRVTVEVAAIAGPPLELQNLGPNEILGWSWLIPPYKWHFQARAEEPSRVTEFDGEAILAHCEEDAAFGYALLKRFSGLMSERLGFARQKMMDEWNPPGFA